MKLPDKHPAKKYTYSPPYTDEAIKELYDLGYEKAIQDVLALVNGEVVNGVLKGVIDAEAVKGLVDAKVSGDSGSVSHTITVRES